MPHLTTAAEGGERKDPKSRVSGRESSSESRIDSLNFSKREAVKNPFPQAVGPLKTMQVRVLDEELKA